VKALVYTAPEKVELQEVSQPVAGDGEVLLKISATGICGSDIHGFLGHSERRKPGLILDTKRLRPWPGPILPFANGRRASASSLIL
jgi:threonine dehydrogenase-like Zn-dependent dehydrogenase